MWLYILIFTKVIAIMFLPYMLIAGLVRVFLPQAKVWRLSLLSVLVTLFVDLRLNFFLNPVRIDRIVADAVESSVPFAELGSMAETLAVGLTFSAMFFGSILIPLGFSRGGIAIVDKLIKWGRPNSFFKGESR